jgi:poly-gamma-glutamate capsule biosynthesis protein CapA/YwtB (metallophosphatase superfamily)
VPGRGAGCWARRVIKPTIVIMITMSMVTAGPAARSSFQERQKPADLWLGGDVNLGDGGSGQLQGIFGIVQGAAGIVNLEGPVAARRGLKRSGLRLWNAPQALAEVRASNVNVAGIANNHSTDSGAQSLKQTAEQLRRHSILPAGGPAGSAVMDVSGISIAVTAHDLTHGVPPNLATELAGARRRANVLVATFHVTGPPSYLPRPELKRAVEIAYRAGALVIAAHGTHAIGPVERRRHAVIVWGLGNVAFACDCTSEQDAILLRVQLEPGRVLSAEVVPIQAGINNGRAMPSNDAKGIFDLLEAIGSSNLQRRGDRAVF